MLDNWACAWKVAGSILKVNRSRSCNIDNVAYYDIMFCCKISAHLYYRFTTDCCIIANVTKLLNKEHFIFYYVFLLI